MHLEVLRRQIGEHFAVGFRTTDSRAGANTAIIPKNRLEVFVIGSWTVSSRKRLPAVKNYPKLQILVYRANYARFMRGPDWKIAANQL
jgi:hypothetical protein